MKTKLELNKEYLDKEKQNLLKIYNDKFVLIVDEKVVGSFDTYERAAEEGVSDYGMESGFLIDYLTDKDIVNFVSLALI